MKHLLLFLFFSAHFAWAQAQQSAVYAYDDPQLAQKPMPTVAFTQWLAENNKKLGKAAPASTKKTSKVTVVLVVDTAGKVTKPMIWRGIGQGYDAYAQQLMQSNAHPWLPGKDPQGKPVATEVYYQIDFVTNKSRVAIKANEVVN